MTEPRREPSFETVKARARGQWPGILAALAPELAPALQRPGKHVACPVHGGKDGFRLFEDAPESGGAICNTCGSFPDGFALLGWLRRQDARAALLSVAAHLGIEAEPRAAGTGPPAGDPPEPDPDYRRRRYRQQFRDALKLTDPAAGIARRYLAARDLSELVADPPLWRFLPALDYWRAGDPPEKLATLPALIAPVQAPAGELAGLHLTYLAPDGNGKAALDPPRKLRTVADRATRGGAIRLWPADGPRLAIGEGIETCAAVRLACPSLPVWAATSAGALARFEWPPDVFELLILADNDRKPDGSNPGLEAAERLARRAWLARLEVEIAEPPAGCDWNDLLRAGGDA